MIWTGFGLMALGLSVLFAMVIELVAPRLLLALAAYASAFGGMMMAVLATAYWLCDRAAARDRTQRPRID